MTQVQEKMLIETHADVHIMKGILTGGNGGGKVKEVDDHSDDIDFIKEKMVTKTDCKAQRDSDSEVKWNVWKVIATVIPWIGMVIMIIIALKSLG